MRATYSGRARKGARQAASGGRRSWLRQAGMWAGRQAGRQADLAQAARLHVATVAEVTWAEECVCGASI